MLSYRHAFHAGGVSDVFKHVTLCALLDAITRKEAPFFFLDTHAGAGVYDLRGPLAVKRNEYRDGIERLRAHRGDALPAVIARYLDIVAACNPPGALNVYPGSPRIALSFLRDADRAFFAELHGTDHAALAREMRGCRNVTIADDGYAALRAKLPPPERRGLVLIDPAYELDEEPSQVVDTLTVGLRRFGHGVFAIWLPIGGKPDHQRLIDDLRAIAGTHSLLARFEKSRPPADGRLHGSAMFIVNPPFRLDATLAESLAALASILAPPSWVAEVTSFEHARG